MDKYKQFIEDELVEKEENKLQELLNKYNIIDLGAEKEDRFYGNRDSLRNFYIEAEKLQLI